MFDYRIASRYGKSILDLAKERNELEKIHEEFQNFSATLQSSKELRNLLKSPIIPVDKKTKVMRAIFENNMGELSMAFIELVLKKKREAYLGDIAEYFHLLYNQEKSITMANVTSASPLTDTQRNHILKVIEEQIGQKVELKSKIDPKLIAGFVLNVGDKQIDASMANQINELRKEFKENPYVRKY